MILLLKIDKAICKNIVFFALPAICESIIVSLLVILNSYMVSSLGTISIAAVTLTNQPYKIILVIFTAFNTIITKYIAECLGRNNHDAAALFLRYGLFVTIILSLLLALITNIFSNEIISLMGSNNDTHELAVSYFRIFIISLVPSSVCSYLNAVKRGCQNSKISFISNLILNVVSVTFGYLLIYGFLWIPPLNIQGAAIAIVVGSTVAMIVSFSSFSNKNDFLTYKDFVIKNIKYINFLKKYRAFWIMVLTLFFEFLLTRLGFMIVSAMIARIGTLELAVDKIAMNFLEIVFSFGSGLQIAAITMISKSIGKNDWNDVKKYTKTILQIGFIVSFCLSIIFIIFGKFFICLFFDDVDVSYYAYITSIISSLIVLFQIPQLIFNGILRGLGKTKITLCVSILSILVILVSLVYVDIYILHLGLISKWISSLITQAVWCTILFVVVYKTIWKLKK